MLSSYSVTQPGTSPETVTTQQQPQIYNPVLTPPPTSLPSSPETCSYSEVYSPPLDDNDLLGVITSDSDETSINIDFTKGFLSDNTDQFSYDSGKNWMADNYTTGLCLLVILFSFGLFFNGILLEGISVMVSPVGSTTTTRTLFNFKEELTKLELDDLITYREILDPGCTIDPTSNSLSCNETLVENLFYTRDIDLPSRKDVIFYSK